MITNRCHRCLSFTWMTKAKNKKHEDEGFYHCLLGLKGAGTKGEEDDDNHKSLSSIFHRNDESIKKEDTKTIALCCCLYVWEEQEQEEEVKMTMIKLSSSFIFHRSNEGQRKKHEDDNTKLLSLCLRGAKTKGEKDDDQWLLLSFVFTGVIKVKKKEDTKMIALCHCLHVWEDQEQEEEAKTSTIFDQRHFLFFIGTTKATRKKHKDNDTKLWSSIFHRSD